MTPFRMALGAIIAQCSTAAAVAEGLPRYEHILVIVAENKNYEHIIGSEIAPRLNKLAKEYGLAASWRGPPERGELRRDVGRRYLRLS